ncbi:MAG: alpha-ketoacid dehydrogenase subunit beta, partial [bacterium]|nr:alpha-ketoacid dehydrogenase subunit beta [bacterium]
MTRTLNIKDALNEALRQEMEADSRIVVMGEDIAGGAGRDDVNPEGTDCW